jgi:hypothetical protein
VRTEAVEGQDDVGAAGTMEAVVAAASTTGDQGHKASLSNGGALGLGWMRIGWGPTADEGRLRV